MAVANTQIPRLSAGTRRGSPRTTFKTIPVGALGTSLSLFFAISFVLCVLGYLLERTFGFLLQIAHSALALVLPGFQFDSWSRFFVGFAESLAWGWYIALIFGPLYNFFVTRQGRER